MIEVGQRYTLAWKYPHRIDCIVVEIRQHIVVAIVDHRCKPYCELLKEYAATLTLSGRRRFFYDQFVAQFVPIPDGPIPLPPGVYE